MSAAPDATARPNRLLQAIVGAANWTRGRPRRQAWMLAFGLGAFLPLAFAPWFVLPMLVIALTGLIWLLDASRDWRAALALGWWFGFGQFLTGLFWIANAFSVREGVSYGQGLAAVLLLAAALALFPALAAAAARRLWSPGDERILIFAICWSAAEWLRGHLFTGFPWNFAGHALAFDPAAMQLAAYVGAYGLSLLVLLLAAAPAAMAAADGAKPSWRPLAAAAAASIMIAGFGLLRLSLNPSQFVPDLALVTVQANIPQERKWHDDLLRDHFHRHIEMSQAALRHAPGGRALVIWPETAIAFDPQREFTTRYLISKALDRPGVVLTGAPHLVRDGDGQLAAYNSLFAVDDAGNLQGRYDKTHLVPFGEYVPGRGLLQRLGIGRLVPSGIDFAAGPGPRTLTPAGVPPFSPLICYEAIFPGAVTAGGGAPPPAWMLNISNDAWFGDSHGPHQHFAIARMRSIEEGIPMVRATNTGISAVIDPVGRILYTAKQNKTDIIVGQLPEPLQQVVPYRLWRDWGYLAMLALMAGLFARYRAKAKNNPIRT
ncbi:MAG: apolipoprotein N-acyltransferase [Sphingomonadales bacterium]